MAQRELNLGLALVVLTAMWASSSAQTNCPPGIISLQPCLAFIMSNSSTPPPQCCTQLANLAQSQAQCLCTLVNLAPQPPFNINQTQVTTLPGACNIQTPPLSQCNAPSGASVPAAGSPQEAPSPASPATPSGPGGGSPTTPSTGSAPSANGGSKDGSNKGQSSSARSSISSSPSLIIFFSVASVFFGF